MDRMKQRQSRIDRQLRGLSWTKIALCGLEREHYNHHEIARNPNATSRCNTTQNPVPQRVGCYLCISQQGDDKTFLAVPEVRVVSLSYLF